MSAAHVVGVVARLGALVVLAVAGAVVLAVAGVVVLAAVDRRWCWWWGWRRYPLPLGWRRWWRHRFTGDAFTVDTASLEGDISAIVEGVKHLLVPDVPLTIHDEFLPYAGEGYAVVANEAQD